MKCYCRWYGCFCRYMIMVLNKMFFNLSVVFYKFLMIIEVLGILLFVIRVNYGLGVFGCIL